MAVAYFTILFKYSREDKEDITKELSENKREPNAETLLRAVRKLK
jgi:hypothetical protein